MAKVTLCDICGKQIKDGEEIRLTLPQMKMACGYLTAKRYDEYIYVTQLDACEECCKKITKKLDSVVPSVHKIEIRER